MSKQKTRRIKTRKLPLAMATIGSGYLYEQGQAGELPNLSVPLDFNQHASHIGAGVALGYILRYLGEIVECTRNRAFMASVIGATTLGGLFEATADMVWYRNTTPDVIDASYVAVSSIIGAACVKKVVPCDVSQESETISLQTD